MQPSSGVSLLRFPGTGGKIRRASLITARRYSRRLTLIIVISDSVLKAVRTSLVSLARIDGFMSRWYVTPQRRLAVVSAPAAISRPPVSTSSSYVIPSLVSRVFWTWQTLSVSAMIYAILRSTYISGRGSGNASRLLTFSRIIVRNLVSSVRA